ncbi:uncharacterized protein [Physcomitrium patens]|uniref:Phytocyanin domain-containing protein n=1 Tax=Physcomitrium patens TaxID=3218 RepID=A0A2K1L0S9_PHYPA|nr:uncharacterized protein LOC112277102 [Physcomitrium patens]PNR59639.1 hypothetical protein PHYPA_002431 [Physcomitrium patens]|eukprot:XP_024364838.1 uncharacterized protein LOC112277102 [Physcomitrella patens]
MPSIIDMARVVHSFRAVLLLAMLASFTANAQQSGPKLGFFNYSGMQATVRCVDYPTKVLEAGDTFYIPLTRSDQVCIVTLKDGEHASAVIDKVLPSSSNSGHSVSVDINDTFLFFALDDTHHHHYVNFLDSQDEQIQIQRSSDLQLWTMEESMDE